MRRDQFTFAVGAESRPVSFETLKITRAADAAYGVLKDKILAGELKPGQRLEVGQMAEQLGVSRTPIKDALQRLSTQGLIEIRARKGTFVARVRAKDLEETFDIREALELTACELLRGKLDQERAARLLEINEKMKNPQLTRMDHVFLNHEFHRTMVEFTGNNRLHEIYSDLSTHELIARILPNYDDWKGPLSSVVEEHDKIVRALIENRTQEAKNILSNHIQMAKQRLLARIAATESGI